MSIATPLQIKVGRQKLRVSNLDKVLYPATGFTKGEVIDYYRQVAPVILKHLKGRPLTLKRYPNGVESGFFYEKNCPSHKPDWVPTVAVKGSSGTTNYCVMHSAPALLWVANLASIEMHTLLAREESLDRPTMMVFDLDPGPPASLLNCLPVALRMRDMLEHLGLQCFAKTSGSKGLHFYVPLNTPVTFDQTKDFSKAIAMLLEKDSEGRVISIMRKDLRAGRIFVDWSQNDQHKTTVCAYSLRAVQRPLVSTPITWDEIRRAIRRKSAEFLQFEPKDVLKRVEKFGDLMEPVLKLKQRLPSR